MHPDATPPNTTHTPDAETSPNYKWWVVFMLWFICFFNYADRQALAVVLPKLKEEFGFDEATLGLISSAFMWVYAFGAPLAGYIADRVRRKDLILGGCLFWSFVTVLTGWCSKAWHFITVRALEGFGETFYFPASMSLVSDYHSPRTRSRAMSAHQSSVYIGTIGGSWIAAWFAEQHDWRWGFYLFGGMGMVLSLMLYFFLMEPRRGQSERAAGSAPIKADSAGEVIRRLATTPTAVLLMLGFFCANAVAGVILGWTAFFLHEKFHYSLTKAGLIGSSFIQVSSAISVPIGGWMADTFSRRRAGGRMLVQGLALLGGAGFIVMLGRATEEFALIAAMCMFGLFKGLYDSNIFASMYDVVPPQARASAAGLMNTIGWIGGACATAVFGWLVVHGSYPTKVENMSHTIAYGGGLYIVAATLILTAFFVFAKRDVLKTEEPAG